MLNSQISISKPGRRHILLIKLFKIWYLRVERAGGARTSSWAAGGGAVVVIRLIGTAKPDESDKEFYSRSVRRLRNEDANATPQLFVTASFCPVGSCSLNKISTPTFRRPVPGEVTIDRAVFWFLSLHLVHKLLNLGLQLAEEHDFIWCNGVFCLLIRVHTHEPFG
jgi:hypothetical protein